MTKSVEGVQWYHLADSHPLTRHSFSPRRSQDGLRDCAPLLRRDVGRLLQQLLISVSRQASVKDVAGMAAREWSIPFSSFDLFLG